MAQKIKRSVCFSKPLEIILLVLVFLTFNFLFLSSVEKKLAKNLAVRDEFPSGKREKRHNLLIENTFQDESQQLITFEEDGRFGNLLLETATLLLIGRKLNKQVNLLPQVAQKLKYYFSSLPAKPIDHTKVNITILDNININMILLLDFEVSRQIWFRLKRWRCILLHNHAVYFCQTEFKNICTRPTVQSVQKCL